MPVGSVNALDIPGIVLRRCYFGRGGYWRFSSVTDRCKHRIAAEITHIRNIPRAKRVQDLTRFGRLRFSKPGLDLRYMEVTDEIRNKDGSFEAMQFGGRLSTDYGARIIQQLASLVDCAMAGPRDCLTY